MLDSSVPVNIGSFESNVSGIRVGFFDGLIDEVEIFTRALSGAEIQAIFDAGSAGKCKVDCNGNGISDVQDIAGATSQDCKRAGRGTARSCRSPRCSRRRSLD